ncbi:hypothetical protein J6590_017406 [Homalodisca vitripennis]|nr:hypothetical protein J6590_017406 [Homalodisca vitripennis]
MIFVLCWPGPTIPATMAQVPLLTATSLCLCVSHTGSPTTAHSKLPKNKQRPTSLLVRQSHWITDYPHSKLLKYVIMTTYVIVLVRQSHWITDYRAQ